MTVFQTNDGVLKLAKAILTVDTPVAIVTAGNYPATVEYVRLTEIAGSTPSCVLDVYDTATATVLVKVRGAKALVANGTETDRDALIIEPGEVLRATASAADQIHVSALYSVPA